MRTTRTLASLTALGTVLVSTAALAQGPVGVWIDHTGRGAVEIKECGGGLCGHVVWLKDSKHKQSCRTQIIGNVRQVSNGVWDRGWILDPDDNSRYSVELKMVGGDRLQVIGYMGSKLFSETMYWRRAPADLKRCDGVQEAAVTPPPAPPAPVPAYEPPAAQPRVAAPAAPPAPAAAAPPPPPPPPAPSDYQIDPAYRAPPPPPRQAAVTAPTPPPAVEPPPASSVAPSSGPAAASPDPARTGPSFDAEPQPGARSRRQASGKGRGSKRECSIDVPYLDVTVKYPCDAF